MKILITFLMISWAQAAHYPFPTSKSYNNLSAVGPIYGGNHLANHAHSILLDLKAGDLEASYDVNGKITKIISNSFEGSTIKINWNGAQIVSVDLDVIPSAPSLVNVTDKNFLKFIEEVISELIPPTLRTTGSSSQTRSTWQDFLEKQLGSLKDSYSADDLDQLVTKNFEIRMRFKTLPPNILNNLGLKKISDDPFHVKAVAIQTLSRSKILEILENQSIPECENILKRTPF